MSNSVVKHEQIVEGGVGSAIRYERAMAVAALLAVAGAVILAAAPSTAVTVASLLLLVAAFSLEPAFSVPLLALVLPFYLFTKSLGAMSFSMPELLLVCGVGGAAIHAVWRRLPIRYAGTRLATPFDLPIALFLAAALISLLASEVMRVSLRDLRTLVVEPVAAFYLATWLLRRRLRLSWLLAALLLGGVAAAFFGLLQYFVTGQVITAEGARRMLGPYQSPNELGLYLGRTIPLALAIAIFIPKYRLPASAALAILGAALVLTFSVGAWLATLLAIAAMVLVWRPRALPVLVGAAAVLGLVSLPVLSSERVASHLSLTSGTSFFRVELWESSLRMIRDHPILGVGMDNFLYQYRSGYMQPGAVAEPNLSHPHNLVLNFWLQTGIAGLAAFVWLLVALARVWRRLWDTDLGLWERATLAGLVGAAVDMVAHGMVDNSYYLVDLAFFFWLSAAVIAALSGRGARYHAPLPGPSRIE